MPSLFDVVCVFSIHRQIDFLIKFQLQSNFVEKTSTTNFRTGKFELIFGTVYIHIFLLQGTTETTLMAVVPKEWYFYDKNRFSASNR
jgi:hypothetical protein